MLLSYLSACLCKHYFTFPISLTNILDPGWKIKYRFARLFAVSEEFVWALFTMSTFSSLCDVTPRDEIFTITQIIAMLAMILFDIFSNIFTATKQSLNPTRVNVIIYSISIERDLRSLPQVKWLIPSHFLERLKYKFIPSRFRDEIIIESERENMRRKRGKNQTFHECVEHMINFHSTLKLPQCTFGSTVKNVLISRLRK